MPNTLTPGGHLPSVVLDLPDGLLSLPVTGLRARNNLVAILAELRVYHGEDKTAIPAGCHRFDLYGEDGSWCGGGHRTIAATSVAFPPLSEGAPPTVIPVELAIRLMGDQ